MPKPSKKDVSRLEAINQALAHSLTGEETTRLSPEQEEQFQAWAKRQGVADVDHPDSHYDYRGFWLQNPEANIRGGRDHFPDTYKQHGHPTFSTESQYSKSFDDGGYWDYDDGKEKFNRTARPELKSPDYSELDAAYARMNPADTPAANKVAAQNVGMQALSAPPPSPLPAPQAAASPPVARPGFNVGGGMPDLSALDEAYRRQGMGG
jgi:hypothetical protein